MSESPLSADDYDIHTGSSVSAPFILRPVATSLLALAVLICGVLGYMRLAVSALPQIDFPTIQVSTQLPGANPDTIAQLVQGRDFNGIDIDFESMSPATRP